MKIVKTKTKRWKRPGKNVPKFDEFTFTLPIYSGYSVTVLIAANISAAGFYVADRDYYREPDLPEGEDGTAGYCWSVRSQAKSFIVLRPDAQASTVAHECWHIAHAVMEYIGAKVENEFVAYLIGYIVSCVTEFQKKVQSRWKKYLGVKSKTKTEGHNADHRSSSTKGLPRRSRGRRRRNKRTHKAGRRNVQR